MKYGICHLSVVPCRLEPSDSSEMVTQLLFGEVLKIYEEKRVGWRKIKTAFDDYDCWVDEKQFIEINETEFERLNTSPITICSEMANIIEDGKYLHNKRFRFLWNYCLTQGHMTMKI